MPLRLPPSNFKELHQLVAEFNLIPSTNDVERLFNLQKINYVINTLILNEDLFNWLDLTEKDSWQGQLKSYDINPDASFFLKGIQFAQAVNKRTGDIISPTKNSAYELMQARDGFMKNKTYEQCKEDYSATCFYLSELAKDDIRISTRVTKQLEVLKIAYAKFEAIKGHSTEKHSGYSTQELNKKQINNFNYKFNIAGWPSPLVFRVEDRPDLGLEQELHSYDVEKYFIEDFGVFMMEFQNKQDGIEYKPVVLSEFANQGNLFQVAAALKDKSQANIASITGIYFTQLGDLCQRLINSKVYHPDIKLANFLVHNNLVLMSDRKTLTRIENPKANQIRSSKMYAPEEYRRCILTSGVGFNIKGEKTIINMPQFMSYQLGMALKEFLLLTQMEDIPDDFQNTDRDAFSYFDTPNPQIINLFLLVQELTRKEASKRLTIAQFQELLFFRNSNPQNFYEKVEEMLPSSNLGIEEDILQIKKLLASNLNGKELTEQANVIFTKLSKSGSIETRVTRLAEQLASKCFHSYSKPFFQHCSRKIEEALLAKDWEEAPWYRKLIHWLSNGYFRVDKVADISTLEINVDLKGEEFQFYFVQLEFLTLRELEVLGEEEVMNFQDFIESHLDQIQIKDIVEIVESEEPQASPQTNDNPFDNFGTTRLEKPSAPSKEPTEDSEEKPEKKSKEPEKKAESKFSFFSNSDEKLDEAPTNRKKVSSVKSALFRGDGSNRLKKKPQHPSITAFFEHESSNSELSPLL